MAPEVLVAALGLPARRRLLAAVAALLVLFVLLAPFADWAAGHEWVEAVRFSVLSMVAPAFIALGAPWASIGLGPSARRLSEKRRRHPEASRTGLFVAAEIAAMIAFRTPGAVDWLAGAQWRPVLEALVLVSVGVGFWLECVESPPLAPRTTRPLRMVIAALAMWTVWVLAYLVGLSHASWYHAYHHAAGVGLSLTADQQIMTGTLWFLAACAFLPVIFWNLVLWLHSEEDPDQELYRLTRQERRRSGWWSGE